MGARLNQSQRRKKRLINRDGEYCKGFPILAHKKRNYCEGPLTLHHILPRAHGGTNKIDNLILVCERHHVFIHMPAHRKRAVALGLLELQSFTFVNPAEPLPEFLDWKP